MCAVCVAVVAGIEVGGANEAKGDEIEKVVTNVNAKCVLNYFVCIK